MPRQENYQVPDEWLFEDECYSGANLIRPGLERIRDLAAEGQIEAVLALSPDRLSRKYAYQVLLTEELARHGVDMVFINRQINCYYRVQELHIKALLHVGALGGGG